MNTTQIRCYSCGHWNQVDDLHVSCVNCGADLRPISESDLASLERRKTTGELKVIIYESDSQLKRIAKHVYNSVVLVYMSIIAFFIWVFAAGPG
jgi:DNA-directed RNA polymerase subunit RPC12/RpoP